MTRTTGFFTVAFAFLGLILASQAAADSNDDAYLAALAKYGITCPSDYYGCSSNETLITVGKTACDVIDKGKSPAEVALLFVNQISGITTQQAGAMVGAAVDSYCPWNEDAPPSPSATPRSAPNTKPSSGANQLPITLETATLGDPCSDWAKLAADNSTGKTIVCLNDWPAKSLNWHEERTPLSGGPFVAGTACPAQPQWVMTVSTDGYMIWCVNDPIGLLPGGTTVHPTGPTWLLYSP
jgi:hypothetical protein